jgi:putative Mn2+ efflux pump MntP
MGVLRDFFYILAHWFLNEYVNRGFVKITWTSISSGLIAIIGLILFYERLKNQGKQVQIQGEQIQIQIKQRVDERFDGRSS